MTGNVLLIRPSVAWRVQTERESTMSKFFQKTLVLTGSVALVALMAAAPVAPASAQGVPAALMQLDPPQRANDGKIAELDRARVRSAYARSNRKVVQAR
jgi:hypothetical protein